MNEPTVFYLAGLSLGPALIAFAATYFHRKGSAPTAVSAQRRLIAATVIYVVCFGSELVFRTILHLATTPNTQAYESPLLILSGIIAYLAGKRVITPNGQPPTKSA